MALNGDYSPLPQKMSLLHVLISSSFMLLVIEYSTSMLPQNISLPSWSPSNALLANA